VKSKFDTVLQGELLHHEQTDSCGIIMTMLPMLMLKRLMVQLLLMVMGVPVSLMGRVVQAEMRRHGQ
jgi:hypothetical protein